MLFWNRNKNRKWQKRPQLYRGKFYYVKRMLFICFIGAFLASVVVLVISVRNSDSLYIKRVSVLGERKHLSQKDIMKLSGIKNSDRIFSLSLDEVSQRILRHPWIFDVRVRTEFPDAIQIHVTEQNPIAIIYVDDFYFVNQKGVVFKKIEPQEVFDLPVITGFEKDFVTKYPHLAKKQLLQTLKFLEQMQASAFYEKYPLSEIRFDPVYGFTLFTKNQFEIFYGKTRIDSKQKKLEIFSDSTRFDPKKFLRLDLDTKDKIIVKTL